MPTPAELNALANDLHSRKLVNLDASMREVLEAANANSSTLQTAEWHAVVGSTYLLITTLEETTSETTVAPE